MLDVPTTKDFRKAKPAKLRSRRDVLVSLGSHTCRTEGAPRSLVSIFGRRNLLVAPVKKLHLILLSLVSAIPGGYLCYLLGTALAMPRTDLWKKPLLGGTVVGTGLLVLLLAVVWPLLYAVAFYRGPEKSGEDEEPAEADGDAEIADAEDQEGFEQEDIDVFEREGVSQNVEEADEFEAAAEGSEFDLEEDNFNSAETADFEALEDGDFEDMELEEEAEEAPKKKKGKGQDKSKKKKK
jgi:hypothetical protein